MSNFNDGVMDKEFVKSFMKSFSEFVDEDKKYHAKHLDLFRKYTEGIQDVESYKQKLGLSAKEQAVNRIVTNHAISLAREICWAEEAVEKIGMDGFSIVSGEFGAVMGAFNIGELKKLKLSLWDAKASEYITLKRLEFSGFENPDLAAKFKEEQEALTVKIVTHVLTHGQDDPRYVGGVDPVLPYKNMGIMIPQGKGKNPIYKKLSPPKS